MEGQIDTSRKEWATNGERVQAVKHQDNLKTEGAFVSRQTEEWAPGERAEVVKVLEVDAYQEKWETSKAVVGTRVLVLVARAASRLVRRLVLVARATSRAGRRLVLVARATFWHVGPAPAPGSVI